MFYVDTVEENQLPFDGCTVEENTSSKPPAPRFSQSKNISPQIDSQQIETCFPKLANDKWPFCKHLEPFCCKLHEYITLRPFETLLFSGLLMMI